MILGDDERLRLVGRTYRVSTRTLVITNRTIGPNVSAGRVSAVTCGLVGGEKTAPGFLNLCKFPTATYVSVGGRIVRNVPDGRHVVRRNSVMDVSLKTTGGNCGNSGTTAFITKAYSPRTGQLVSAAHRDLCGNVRRTMPNGGVNSVNRTIRACYRRHNCNIIHSFINRNINAGLRRSPDMPGFKRRKHNVELLPKVALTVRPVVGRKACGMGRLRSK